MRFPRLTRHWAVPGLALLTMLGVGTLPHVIGSAGADTPDLPALTPAELGFLRSAEAMLEPDGR